jgi:hypothetical protein
VVLSDLDPELHRLSLGIPMGVLWECEEHRRVPLRCGPEMMFSRRSPQGVQQTERLGLAPDRRYPRPMFGRDRLSSDVSEIKLRRLATLILLLALGGCAQVATGQGQAPAVPYPHDSGSDIRSM